MIQIIQMPKQREWLSRKQAAEYCNMCVRQFDRERQAEPELLEPDGFAGKTPQWKLESLDRYLSRHKHHNLEPVDNDDIGRFLDAKRNLLDAK